MVLREAGRTAWREIKTHKARSALSFFAFAIGAASILYTFAQTHGMRQATVTAIELQGPGRLSVGRKRNYKSKGLSPGLTLGDVAELQRAMPELYMVYPKTEAHFVLHYKDRKIDEVRVVGTTPEWRKRDWVFKLRGRFLNNVDVEGVERICVIVEPGGWHKRPYWALWWEESPWEKFAVRHDLLGKHVKLQDRDFLVVGVLKAPPRDLDPRWYRWQEANVLVPMTSMNRFLHHGERFATQPDSIGEIEIDTGDEATMPAVRTRVTTLLKRRHRGEEDFEIADSRDAIQNEINEMNKYVLTFSMLGAIAIFSGGIGIMNVMLAAMFSRIKEIGIRRAIGASKLDILSQFIAEAAMVGLTGGLVGVGIGKLGIVYFNHNAEKDLSSITWYHFLGVVAISVAAACLFSFYPALKASQLDPVEALRNE